MKRNEKIKLPVKQKFNSSIFTNSDDYFSDLKLSYSYNVIERDIGEIEDLINRIHHKYQDELQEGNSPTYLMINKIDYDFLNAYFRYGYEPIETYWKMDNYTNRKLKEIFGLKLVISSSDLFRIGWEP